MACLARVKIQLDCVDILIDLSLQRHKGDMPWWFAVQYYTIAWFCYCNIPESLHKDILTWCLGQLFLEVRSKCQTYLFELLNVTDSIFCVSKLALSWVPYASPTPRTSFLDLPFLCLSIQVQASNKRQTYVTRPFMILWYDWYLDISIMQAVFGFNICSALHVGFREKSANNSNYYYSVRWAGLSARFRKIRTTVIFNIALVVLLLEVWWRLSRHV